jgi:alpha-L-rhamnosidase
MKLKTLLLSSIFLFMIFCIDIQIFAQQNKEVVNPYFLSNYWYADWITHPTADLKGYGVYHFRKVIELPAKPDQYVIHVSADNRYRLFVNGTAVCFGPARSDLNHWNFETLDISSYLKPGKNLLAAVVWNFGEQIPVAQITRKTAFLLQGNSESEQAANTDKSWKVIKNDAYAPLEPDQAILQTFIVVGPGDKVNGEIYPWNWQYLSFDDSKWLSSKEIGKGRAKGLGTGADWDLVPRDIPFLEETIQRFSSIRREEGCHAGENFLQGKESLAIPANTKVVLLLDQGVVTVAYPEIIVSDGKGSEIEAIYAESLFDDRGNKGNRNEIAGKTIKGITDIFYVGSAENETFRPLWFRTFRYMQLNIKTGDKPLIIKNIQSVFTAYPFKENASFKCNDPEISKIWEVGWRTLRLCSNETHYDCPYYEQLQYIGDTRIQCLISSYVSGDDRLMRKAIQSFDRSRFYEGLTCSRYPSNDVQVIPPFSLFWTNMIHDYWLLRNDTAFIKPLLFGIENVLNWYENHIDPQSGMLGQTPYWNFVDWPSQWPWDNRINSGGVPKGGAEGGSSILTLQLAYSLNEASELFYYFGKNYQAEHYKNLANKISIATIDRCWDSNRKLLADTPEKNEFSQHANIMAIMANAALPIDAKELIDRVSRDNSLIQATFYYRFYLLRAMKKAGLADKYVEMLEPWRNMLKLGLTTFAEKPEPTRSDCHAWSASPNYELLATVCGIEPAEAGFKTVRIEPHLGILQWVEGSMPHPNGNISVKFLKTKSSGLEGEIILPAGLKGIFVFQNKTMDLKEGINRIGY